MRRSFVDSPPARHSVNDRQISPGYSLERDFAIDVLEPFALLDEADLQPAAVQTRNQPDPSSCVDNGIIDKLAGDRLLATQPHMVERMTKRLREREAGPRRSVQTARKLFVNTYQGRVPTPTATILDRSVILGQLHIAPWGIREQDPMSATIIAAMIIAAIVIA